MKRIYEDILDDLEARDLNAARKLSAEADDALPRHRYDDRRYFNYTFYINGLYIKPVLEKYDVEHWLKYVRDRLEHILECNIAIIDYSDVIYYDRDKESQKLPNVVEPITSDYNDYIVFSIRSDFKNIKQVFKFIVSIYIALRSSSNDMFIEISSKRRRESLDVECAYIYSFVRNDMMTMKPTYSMDCVRNTVECADFFFDRETVVKQMEKYYLKQVNWDYLKRVSENKNIEVVMTDDPLTQTLRNNSITYVNFMRDYYESCDFKAMWRTDDLIKKPYNNAGLITKCDDEKDSLLKYFAERTISNPQFDFIYSSRENYLFINILMGIYSYVYTQHQHRTCVLVLREILTRDEKANVKRMKEFLSHISRLFNNCLSDKDINKHAKRLAQMWK